MSRVFYLHEYIAQVGDEAAARILGLTVRTARSYRLRWREPRIWDVPHLIERSGGVLSLESFFPPPREMTLTPRDRQKWDERILSLSAKKR